MEDFDFYPQKPELIEQKTKGKLSTTVLSVVLFVMTFLFLFSEEVDFIFHLLIVLLIHELGHFLLMKLFKYDNVRMLFVPLMGAFVQGNKEEYSQKQSLWVVIAGPLPGIIIGALLLILAGTIHQAWMVNLGLLFLFLNLLNLVPLDPLDGGQLFRLLMKKDHDLFLLVFSFISSLVLIAFGWYIDSWVMIVFGFLMGLRVRSIQRNYYLRKELKEEEVQYTTTYKKLSNRDFSKIKDVLLSHTPTLKVYMDELTSDESGPIIASQVNNVLVSPVEKDAGILFKLSLIIVWITAVLAPFFALVFLNDSIKEHYGWYLDYLSNK